MRQIGVRDEVKLMGGIGVCGREVCCKAFLTSFEPISIRMAKKQERALNPGKLSGICGRLMCCLGYEMEQPAKKEPAAVGDESVIVTEDSVIEEKSYTENVPMAFHPAPPPAEIRPEKSHVQPSRQGLSKEQQAAGAKKDHVPHRDDKGRPFSRRKKFFKKKKI
ncbi:MAG: hypothetical protein HY758_03800 [Nitrospirae bacterium]|nr:hypothetical protein [Nitrospirota bacterium]